MLYLCSSICYSVSICTTFSVQNCSSTGSCVFAAVSSTSNFYSIGCVGMTWLCCCEIWCSHGACLCLQISAWLCR